MIAYLRRHYLALLALAIALGGTSYAASKIDSRDVARNAIKGKHIAKGGVRSSDVRDDTLTGVDILEESLATVPEAARVGGGQVCRTPGVLTIPEAGPESDRTVCTVGALSIVAGCRPAGANSSAILLIKTSQNGAFARTASSSYASFDANDAQLPAIDSHSDAPGGGPEVGPAGPSSFFAGAPDGSQLAGAGGVWADADTNSCKLVVAAVG